MIKRRQFLKEAGVSLFSASFFLFSSCRKVAEAPPNIICFMADDLGYSDLSCFDSKDVQTPILDQLANEGIRFTNFYAAAPNCSPSRAAILTGRFPSRVGIYSYLEPNSVMSLQKNETTIATLLQENGYETAHMGKWHLRSNLAENKAPTPTDHGFSYWLATENNAEPSHKNPINFVRNGKGMGEIPGYASQIVADEVILWLNEFRNPKKPFFLNIWFHEPHRKVAAPPEYRKRHQGKKDAAYFACIENMDNAIGRILHLLEEKKLLETTYILFTSDNGSYRENSNGNFKGRKSFVWEGGIRVPAIMRYPGYITPSSLCEMPSGGVDFFPTVCDLVGIDLPKNKKIDGASLKPLFSVQNILRKKPLFWFFYRTDPACALRDGDWSLVGYLNEKVPPGHSFRPEHMVYLKKAKLIRFELYNLKKDPSQNKDVSYLYPEVFKKLKGQMILMFTEIIAEGPEWY
jgi:arylsulfatase A